MPTYYKKTCSGEWQTTLTHLYMALKLNMKIFKMKVQIFPKSPIHISNVLVTFPFTREFGSSLQKLPKYADVAQMEEHRPFKAGVTGSNPVIRTKIKFLIF